jgi:hypothetical protein
MQFKAKLIELLPLQSGEGKNGTWRKQDIIVETESIYPKKICVSCWGSLADNEMIKEIGKTFVFSIDIESREYNNKWYTDVKAWKIEVEITNENKKIIDLTEYEDDPF